MTPEQLRDDIARDDATPQEIQRVTERYRESDNPFLQEMAKRCSPHAPCPQPDSCNADRICIYRCQWFADTAANRDQLEQMARGEIWFLPSDAPISDTDAPKEWRRHTVDITGPAPQYVEDDMISLERRWRFVKILWWALRIALVGFVLWRIVHRGGQ